MMLDYRVGGREEHALMIVLPAHKVRWRTVFSVDFDDYAFALPVTHSASPDLQFIAHLRLHRLPPLTRVRSCLDDLLADTRAKGPLSGPPFRSPQLVIGPAGYRLLLFDNRRVARAGLHAVEGDLHDQ